METTAHRPVRTYGKPKPAAEDAAAISRTERLRVPDGEDSEEGVRSNAAVSEGTPVDPASSPLGRSVPVVWDALRKGENADWRKVLLDDDDEEDDDAGGNAYELAKRAVLVPPNAGEASSSLPPLTSDDPLAFPDPMDEDETVPLNPRKRTIASTPASHSPSDESPTPRGGRTRRTRTPRSATAAARYASDLDLDTDTALPSSQPEYQRMLDTAREKRGRRPGKARAVSPDDEDKDEQEQEQGGREGLQTSPSSPSLQRGEPRRRRKVVHASEEEDEDEDEETVHMAEPRRRVQLSDTPPPGEGSDDDDDGGFVKTMGKMFQRAVSAGRDGPQPPQQEPDRDVSPVGDRVSSRRKGKGRARRGDVRSSEEDVSAHEGRKKPPLRGLSEKEKQVMNKEAAQMRAGKEVHMSRIRKEFTVAAFINASVPALTAKIPFRPISQQVSAVPALVPPRSQVPTQSSAVVPTPDSEIGQYSSQQRPTVEVHEEDVTPTRMPVTVPGARRRSEPLVVGLDDDTGSDSDDDDGLKAVMKLKRGMEKTRDEERRRAVFEEKQRVLKARKEAAVKAQLEVERVGTTQGRNGKVEPKVSFLKGVSRARQDISEIEIDGSDADDDDDLVILDTPGLKPAAGKRAAPRPNPRDMLDIKRESGTGGKLRNGGGVLHFAPRQEVTESMFRHAGQTFDQAGKQHREGNASKADGAGGAGGNKLARITDQQSLTYLLEQQRKLAALERAKKERESGLKSRALQPRREQLIDEAVLEETRKAEERRLTMGADEEEVPDVNDDDDSEDDDFAPDAEEDDVDADVDMEDRILVQETQPGQSVEPDDTGMADEATPEGRDSESALMTSAMGAVDPVDETEEALQHRKRKRLAVLDSDEEDGSPKPIPRLSPSTKRVDFGSEGVPESSLVSRKPSDNSNPAPPSFGAGGFDDLGGFGQSGGFSQFFDATQAPGATAAATQKVGFGKGLDVLRQGTPAAGNLAFGNLGAVVSATAQERNLALFGADPGGDAHTGYTPRPSKKQYLNSQGLFTQTTPKLNPLQGEDSVISVDDESMPFQPDVAISSEEPLLEPTYRSDHASSHHSNSELLGETSTPVAPLSRLKRRREQEDEDDVTPPRLEDSELGLPLPDADTPDEEIALPSSQPESSSRAEPAKLDILQKMMAAARSPPRGEKSRPSGMGKEFLENEAELDLEEDGAFFNRLDDEDDEAEGDGVVENLVDDAERTKEQELEDARRRAEIDREYAEQEDARRQKIAQDVIEGKHKGKRRDGLDGVLSSDDEDDDDKRKARRKWRKLQNKRTIGKDLSELAQGETQAFVQAYQGGLASDDSDDEYDGSQDQPPPEDNDARDDDEADDAPTVRNKRPIGFREIEEQVRMLAQQNREREEAMQDEPIQVDSMPMHYVDSDTDQEESQVTISRRRNEQPSLRKESGGDMSKFERWAAAPDNNDSRRAGANSAVTGGSSSSRSLGRNGTSNRSGSFMTTSASTHTKKADKSVRPRASAVMGGVMAKTSGFTDGP